MRGCREGDEVEEVEDPWNSHQSGVTLSPSRQMGRTVAAVTLDFTLVTANIGIIRGD